MATSCMLKVLVLFVITNILFPVGFSCRQVQNGGSIRAPVNAWEQSGNEQAQLKTANAALLNQVADGGSDGREKTADSVVHVKCLFLIFVMLLIIISSFYLIYELQAFFVFSFHPQFTT